MDLDIKKTAYSSHFRDFLISDKRYQILFGSRGSGKTHHIVLKLLIASFKSEYNHILYINKEFRHIRTQQFSEFKKVAKRYDIYKFFQR